MDEHAARWDHCLEYASLSDVGLRRANNQDSMAVMLAGSREKWHERGHLFMVADGMGAHAAGELASKLATDIIPLTYHKLVDRPPPEAILAAIEDANSQINTRGQASEDFRGMGTTVNALLLLPQGAVTAHVGDSRVYRLRGSRLEQLTFDHSLVWELRAARRFSDGEVPSFVPKNVITRSLGPNPDVQVDLEGPFPVQVGDAFLLCSDGLSGPVEDEEIGTILACMPPDEAVRALVDLANLRGGPDNITVIAARVTGPGLSQDGDGRKARGRAPVRPIPTSLWTLLGAFALSAVALVALGSPFLSLLSLLGAVATGIAALVRRYGGESPAYAHDGQPLGKGPYTACDCRADARFVERLVEVTHQLRDAANRDAWTVDWTRFNAHNDRAAAAAMAADYPEAVRQHCHAISFMMTELRNQRRR
ncbi:MAG TPA: protein phosphatase 2C domain-containing protein [Thermoguttaceae bacterium]|nr:protein phosphatase 2C domain-containing protein [Thermoguttaceae bacterium]